MIQQIFVGRQEELKILNRFEKSRPGLFILYGRRRVGKTELVKHFSSGKKALYFLADERPDKENLKELQRIMGRFLGDGIFEKSDIRDWAELFEEFVKRAGRKPVIIIDEFPYLIHSNRAIPSIFQKIWDLNLSKSDIFLILLGSSISMVENYILDYKSPLYGRRSGQLKLGPLRFKDLKEFLPEYPAEDLINVYGVTDGIPLYILKFERKKNFIENIKEHIFSRGEFLYQECEILLKEEFREIANYSLILKAISFGRNRFGEIANFTGLDKTLISKYLDNLMNLHIIRKEFPVTETKELRNAWYLLEDNYFNFWFRFVYPNKSLIEEGRQKELLDAIRNDMNQYMSFIFEKVCKQFALDALPVKLTKIGKWWYKDKEIDLVGLNEKTKEIIFIECKWAENVNPKKAAEDLAKKAEFVGWNNGKRKENYCIIAKSFSEKPKLRNTFLFDIKDVEKWLVTAASRPDL
ncbi:MAG: ATP-binding protein [Candidatus Aenigmarchaeota archaeon]|nr:ATP-binding protein [Candidatus Aenigmarchaeota archaeon]